MFRVTSKFFYNNLRNYTSLEELNSLLAKNQYSHLMVYFRSNWNQQCEITDQHVDKLAG